MSKKVSFKGKLPIGEQDRIRLSTIDGKVGYKITNFAIISTTPGQGTKENIGVIYKTDQTGNITTTVDFSNNDLLGVAYFPDVDDNEKNGMTTVVFDNEVFNQDIFVYIVDASGSTVPCNYYIELEAMSINDLQSTQLTLKKIRNITAP